MLFDESKSKHGRGNNLGPHEIYQESTRGAALIFHRCGHLVENWRCEVNGALWSHALDRIRRKVNTHSYNTWFKPTAQEAVNGKTLAVRVPNPLFAEWLRNNYMPLISQTLEELEGHPCDIVFSWPGSDAAPGPPSIQRANGSGSQVAPSAPLNMRYTFDSFVVGSANRFAHAAAWAVGEKPSLAYNPLYIYGGVGLGKTHLLQAIGHHILASGRPLGLHYVTAEVFMNELITAIRYEKTMEFKERYRGYDVLLVDDIQFLAGKERTQEEFFHTFNSLYDSRRQIVMTSDCVPREIRQIEDRLRSRFEWGLIADIQPPDLETKIAILNKKASAEGVELPSDVALFIGSRIKSNVRELEGSLIRVLAHASLVGREVDIEMAREALQNLLAEQSSVLTVEAIQKRVSEHFNMKVSQLKSRNNARSVTFPRQIAMFLCKRLTEQSLPEIGRKFGGKHHTTVLHAVRKIDEKRRGDRDLDRLIHNLSESLR